MDVTIEPDYAIGDAVIPVDIEDYIEYFHHDQYTVININQEYSEWYVTVKDDMGYTRVLYAARFVAADKSPHGSICRKIKSMEAKRKELGYKW